MRLNYLRYAHTAEQIDNDEKLMYQSLASMHLFCNFETQAFSVWPVYHC